MIESPYAGEPARNILYAQRAMQDSLARGEAPFAMHLLYPLVLDEGDPKEREQGIECGLTWARAAQLVAFYVDYGMSPGMLKAGLTLSDEQIDFTFRTIGPNTDSTL